MNPAIINGFVDELQKISSFNWAEARKALVGEVGPALGATVGAGLAGGFGVNPLAGAAAGYGVGAIPEVVHAIRHRGKPGH